MRVVLDPSQQYFVIACIDAVMDDTIQMRRCTRQVRRGAACCPLRVSKAVFDIAGEMKGEIPLRGRQDVHGEMARH